MGMVTFPCLSIKVLCSLTRDYPPTMLVLESLMFNALELIHTIGNSLSFFLSCFSSLSLLRDVHVIGYISFPTF